MSFEVMDFSGLERELSALGNLDEVAPKMLKAASPFLVKNLGQQIKEKADKGYATGDLERSITANTPRKNKWGYYVSVTAAGKDRKGMRNNEKLAYLNYGTVKQAARPVIATAIKDSENSCIKAMQETFDQETE